MIQKTHFCTRPESCKQGNNVALEDKIFDIDFDGMLYAKETLFQSTIFIRLCQFFNEDLGLRY